MINVLRPSYIGGDVFFPCLVVISGLCALLGAHQYALADIDELINGTELENRL